MCLVRQQMRESGCVANSICLITLLKPTSEALVRKAIVVVVVVGFLWNGHKPIWQLRAAAQPQRCWLTPLSSLSSSPEVWAQDTRSGFHLTVSGRRTSPGAGMAAGETVPGWWTHTKLAIPGLGTDLGWGRLCKKEPSPTDKGCWWTWAEHLVIEGMNCVVTKTMLTAARPCLYLQFKWSLWDL